MVIGAIKLSIPCAELHQAFNARKRLKVGYSSHQIPNNGIYIVFEKGELAHGAERIVRVGTHTGNSNLSKRIKEHLYTPNKDRSIFRKHIGRCLLAVENDPFLEQWNIDMTTRKAREQFILDGNRLQDVETQVTAYIAENFSFCVFPVENKKDRLALESTLLGTVASCEDCAPSKSWLGLHHPNNTIKSSGLWNVQGLAGRPMSPLDVEQMLREVFL